VLRAIHRAVPPARRRLGDRHGEADTLDRLGDVYRTAGDLAAAHRTWQLALEIVETVNPGEAPRIRAKLGSGRT
jgi:hypothetical protein